MSHLRALGTVGSWLEDIVKKCCHVSKSAMASHFVALSLAPQNVVAWEIFFGESIHPENSRTTDSQELSQSFEDDQELHEEEDGKTGLVVQVGSFIGITEHQVHEFVDDKKIAQRLCDPRGIRRGDYLAGSPRRFLLFFEENVDGNGFALR
ncbi:hypothetical protein Tco_0582500 [Tanacetum coccineum]